jgi:hypothetical protein
MRCAFVRCWRERWRIPLEPDDPCGTGVLVLSGSSGALELERAGLFAAHGATTLALRWFARATGGSSCSGRHFVWCRGRSPDSGGGRPRYGGRGGRAESACYHADASSSLLVGGRRLGLLVSGSKVRVLDGPPMITGASRTQEAPADFRSAVLGWARPEKPSKSTLRIHGGGTDVDPAFSFSRRALVANDRQFP